jgi:S1-C subfamily serine protease
MAAEGNVGMTFVAKIARRGGFAVACTAAFGLMIGVASAGAAGKASGPGVREEVQQRGAARAPEVNVVNRTRAVLQNLFVTGVDSGGWGDDRLGADTVAAGARYSVRLEAGQCRYDVRAVYAQGGEETRFGVDFCRQRELVFTPETQTRGSAQPPRRNSVAFYLVRNRTDAVMSTLRVAASGADGEGEDVLGASVLAGGQTFTGRVERGDPCLYTVVAGFEQDERRENVNLCTVRELVFGDPPDAGQGGPQAGGAAPAGPGAVSEVTITNDATITIQVIHIRPAGARNWGEDRLGADVLPAGRSQAFRVSRGPQQCAFDIRVIYERGGEEVRERQDICRTTAYAFTGPTRQAGRGQRKGAPQAAATPSRPDPTQVSDVVIVNRGTQPIVTVNISSSRVQEWGDNHLTPGQTVPPGDRVALRIQRDGQCDFDFLVAFQNGREERRMRQNICTPRDFAFDGSPSRNVDGGGPADGRPFAFVNDGRSEIMEVYATPVSDTHWGDDLLGASTLPRRARLDLRLPRNECRWDVRIVYRGGGNEERRDQDLCATAQMTIGRRGPSGQLVSTGTGFYVTATGHVLTNSHVVGGCSAVAYVRPNGQRVPLRLVAEDEENDLALLREEGATGTPAMPFRAAAEPMRAGERVVLIGYPVRNQLGGYNVTEGLLSSLRGLRGDQTNFQYTAPTQPGNSGGPVIDEYGTVIGVVVAQLDKLPEDRRAQNVNFGIQGKTARIFLEANGVAVTEEAPTEVRRPVDILERWLPSVLPLDCLG